jgi:hypothetical protein
MGENVWSWSKTAASNNTADSSIAWSEGQAAGSVNNSARSMMAAVAKMRDDHGGQLTLGGGTTAYTLTTNQVLGALADGVRIEAVVNATNTAASTLVVDGLASKKIRKVTAAGEANIIAGDMIAAQHATFQYDASADTAAGAWILKNPIRPGIGVTGVTLAGVPKFANTSGVLEGTGVTISGSDVLSAGGLVSTEYIRGDHFSYGDTVSVLDDTATSFAIDTTSNVHFVITTRGTPGAAKPNGLYHWRPGGITAVNPHTTTNITLTTGILAGTTGVDGEFTLSAHTDGNLYLENRSGGTLVVNVAVLAFA